MSLKDKTLLISGASKGMDEETFLILPHPEVLTYLQRKTADYDRWLSGMRRFRDRFNEFKGAD